LLQLGAIISNRVRTLPMIFFFIMVIAFAVYIDS
jgi:hypothetical protein